MVVFEDTSKPTSPLETGALKTTFLLLSLELFYRNFWRATWALEVEGCMDSCRTESLGVILLLRVHGIPNMYCKWQDEQDPNLCFFPSIRKHFLRSSQRKQSRKKMNRRWSKAEIRWSFSGSLKALFEFEVSFTSSICSETSAGRGKESVSFGCNYDAQLCCVVSLCQSRHLLQYSHVICRPILYSVFDSSHAAEVSLSIWRVQLTSVL